MVDIQERIAVSFNGSPSVPIPPQLLAVHGGQKFLNMQGSHPNICRLVCGNRTDLLKGCKNPSLAQSPQLVALREKVVQAVLASGQEAQAKVESDFFA